MDQEEVIDYVIKAVRVALKEPALVIDRGTPLQDLKGFDSLAIVTILEELEDCLRVEIEPTLILPETFSTPTTLAEALMISQQYSSSGA
jgi:acyl carrier protein